MRKLRKTGFRLSECEAEKYLDNSYSSQIYSSESEFIKVQKQLKKYLLENGDTRCNGTEGWEDNAFIYACKRGHIESGILFDKAVANAGRALWSREARKDSRCREVCPFGVACDKKHISIDGQTYCYGQVYIDIPRKLSEEEKYEVMCDMWAFVFEGYIHTQNIVNDMKLSDN
ncbi:MAG: hypothetical protein LBI44_04705 [Oscillospiraceae bacterium]|jgi:hypothetical protein|nr:hypothetical protein [Oscillospiraceae bacterium]